MDAATRADMAAYTGCIAGALTEQEFRDGLAGAGLVDVEIQRPTRSTSTRLRRSSAPASPPSLWLRLRHRLPTRAGLSCMSRRCAAQTGVCGPSVDQQLIDVREDLRWAEAQGAAVSRHNLSSDPDAFVANPKVTGLMAAFGDAALPVLVVDGEIAVHGRYPSREELAGLLARGGRSRLRCVGGDACGCEPGGCC